MALRPPRATAATRPACRGAARRPAPALSADQDAALNALLQARDRSRIRRPRRFLLHGVTGSGKTEVYLRAGRGRPWPPGARAIVLVPEIALTPQALGRFRGALRRRRRGAALGARPGRAPRRVACGCAAGRRGCASAPARRCSRPLADLGLIVVDEEHESSYKHEGDPRYDARRGRRSARPRPAARCSSSGQRHAAAGERAGDAAPARSHARRRPAAAAGGGARHARPSSAAASRDADGPRRPAPRRRQGDPPAQPARAGRTSSPAARAAGVAVPELRRRARPAPQRGLRRLSPLRPPRAGARALSVHAPRCRWPATARAPSGSSTSCARRWLRTPPTRFPSSASTPTPRPSTPRAGTLQALRARRRRGARGHADGRQGPRLPRGRARRRARRRQTLRFPDFRAEERTFALITQLAGRTGRAGWAPTERRWPGSLVQTLAPDARPIRYAVRHDSDGFVADELSRREALSYPPYASLIRVICSAPEEAAGPRGGRRPARRAGRARRGCARTGAAVPAPRPLAPTARDQGGASASPRSTPSAGPSTPWRRGPPGGGRASASMSTPNRPGVRIRAE